MTAPGPVLSILMPVYNERATVVAALDRVIGCDYGVPVELVVVDDGSTDGTTDLIREFVGGRSRVSMHVHDRNLGKGAAVRTALEQASGRFACIFDADLEYDPADLRRLLEPLTDGRAEVVYGTRPFNGHTAYSYWYVMGNRAVTTVANVLFNSYLSDIMTCLKMMDLELFRSLRIRSKGFALEAELTGKLLRLRHRIHEVPISYRARTRAEGKKIKVTDALTVVASLLRCRFARGKAGRAPDCGPNLGPSCPHERIA